MALSGIFRYTRADLLTEIRRIVGDIDASGLTPEIPDARIQNLIADYLQSLTARVAQVQQEQGKGPLEPVRGLSMYRTTGSLTFSGAGVSTFTFPATFAYLISAWDTANNRAVRDIYTDKDFTPPVEKEWREREPGPPEAIVVRGFSTDGNSLRQGELLPAVPGDVTAAVDIEFYRMALLMGAGTDKPDIDPKYQRLAVVGPAMQLLEPDSPVFEQFRREERGLLIQLSREEGGRK